MYDADGRNYCNDCLANKLAESCAGCDFEKPAVLPGNEGILEVLGLCSRQWFCDFSRPYALNWLVVVEVAKHFIDVDDVFYLKLSAFESAAIKAMEKK